MGQATHPLTWRPAGPTLASGLQGTGVATAFLVHKVTLRGWAMWGPFLPHPALATGGAGEQSGSWAHCDR